VNIILGENQYGKAENRVVRIYRDGPRHEIRDVNVTTSLRGDFADAYLTGDQSRVLPTDTQKNTCFAFAKQKGIDRIEDYAIDLARHFVDDVAPVTGARIELEEYAWERVAIDGQEHEHTWTRRGPEVRTALVTVDGPGPDQQTWVVSGLKDLVLLKSTGSEFAGFLKDEYTTLAETHDRMMATSLTARWRYVGTEISWDAVYADVHRLLPHPLCASALAGAAADAVGDGESRPRCASRDRGDQAVRAEHPQLPLRPVAVRHREQW